MKKIFFLLLIVHCSLLIAQTPQVFKYQAVARDASGKIITSKSVSFKISILKGSESGTVTYSETHNLTTNTLGLVNLNIGTGTKLGNDFSSIEWGNDVYFIKLEIDLSDGAGFIFLGTSQLLSVPYALQSLSSDHLTLTASNGKKYKIQVDSNGVISSVYIPKNTCPGLPSFVYGGQTYKTVQIGTQCWMKENLNIGTMINGSVEQTNNGIIEKYCYNDDPNNCDISGGLYQWDEIMQYEITEKTRGICPTDWHIPSDGEWAILTTYLGGESLAGGKMKEAGLTHWKSPNAGATDESGFSLLSGGYRYSSGKFSGQGVYAYMWCSSQYDVKYGWSPYVSYDYDNVTRSISIKPYGYSVRCIKD